MQRTCQARACASQSRGCTHVGAGARQDIARARGGGGEHSSGGSRPSTRPPTKQHTGMRTPAPRAPLGSPPAADTRPGVLQQTRAVWGAGAALPRCPGPRSADLKRAPSNFSKSGRDGRRGAAAQHTHYGAVHRDAGQPRAMRASSAPPGACSARSRAPHALSSRLCARFSARFSERQTRAIFPPKKILTITDFNFLQKIGNECYWTGGQRAVLAGLLQIQGGLRGLLADQREEPCSKLHRRAASPELVCDAEA